MVEFVGLVVYRLNKKLGPLCAGLVKYVGSLVCLVEDILYAKFMR